MFLQVSVCPQGGGACMEGGVHGKGACIVCMVGGMCGRGVCMVGVCV